MKVDLTSFSADDAFDICLHRTSHLRSRLALRLWAMGWPYLLKREARIRREEILLGALSDAESEFSELSRYLGNRTLRRIVDIGCGHALIDIFFWRKYNCSIHLVDIESSEHHSHGYNEVGSGYASLTAARQFLVHNGMPADLLQTTNPRREPLADGNCDAVISLLSCGFHYPAETYLDFVLEVLNPGGVFIFDQRKKAESKHLLSKFETIEIIHETSKYMRMATTKK